MTTLWKMRYPLAMASNLIGLIPGRIETRIETHRSRNYILSKGCVTWMMFLKRIQQRDC